MKTLVLTLALVVSLSLTSCAFKTRVGVPFTKGGAAVGVNVALTLETTEDEFQVPGGKVVLLP